MPSMSENMATGLAEDGSVWQKPAAAVEAKAAAAGLTPTAGDRATTIGMRTAERAERDWMTRCDAVESATTTSMKGQGEWIRTASKAEVATHFAAPVDTSASPMARVAAMKTSSDQGALASALRRATEP